MFARVLCASLALYYVTCEVPQKGNDMPEKGSMLGVDTVHSMKINKDTVINRNLKLERKGSRKNAKPQSHHATKKTEKQDERDPDWSYNAIPKEVSAHVEQFKKNMTDCLKTTHDIARISQPRSDYKSTLKEVQANDKRAVKRLSPKQESPVHGECLIACVLKRNGVIEGGKVHKEHLVALVGKFYAKEAKLMKKLEKNIDRCIDLSQAGAGQDDCAVAARLNACTNDLMAGNKHKIVVDY